MVNRLFTAWLRPACALFGFAGILLLAGCGGGGGAPNNPYLPPPPTILPLTLIPGALTLYPGTPATLTISGGVPPYRAFTTNATALPVTSTVSGDTIVLFANPVTAATTVSIGVQDAVGTIGRDAVVTIQPAPLLPSLITITGNPNPSCPTTVNSVCSGGTGTALVKVTGNGDVGIPGRAVRFDVVQGTFQIVSNNPAQPLVSTLTTVTDSNGNAVVVLAVPPDTPTQTGIVRVTDVVSGQQITGSFQILQVTIDGQVLAVLPTGTTTITGPDTTRCSSGVNVSYYIFGGTPPYTVQTNFPQALTLSGLPVTSSGGSFTATTTGVCFINATFVITDATGRTIPPGSYPFITNQLGTSTPAPPVPTPLVVTPGAIAKNNCVPANTFQFIGTGGTTPYSAVVSSSTSSTSPVITPQTGVAQGTAINISGLTSPSTTVISLFDNSSPRQSQTVTIDCTGTPTPPVTLPLVVAPSGFSFASSCVNQTANFVVTGGSAPYTVFFATPRPGALITPPTVAGTGQGFSVTGLTDGILTTNITIQDSGTPQLQQVVTITCPLTPPNPPPPTPTAIVVTPGTYTYLGEEACLRSASTFGITGGLAPYTVFFSTPGTQGFISPSTVAGGAAPNNQFTVSGLAGLPIPRTIEVTVQDSSPTANFHRVHIDCRAQLQ